MKPEYKEMLDKVIEWHRLMYDFSIDFAKRIRGDPELAKKLVELDEDDPDFDKKLDELSGEFALSRKEEERRYDMHYKLIESGDLEVLRGLMGALTMKVSGGGILDGIFPEQIFSYYTDEQITDAVFEVFDAIYDNDDGPDGYCCGIDVLATICYSLWIPYFEGKEDDRIFQSFRERFNQTRPRHAARFLNRMEEMGDDPKRKAQIETLREDMKKWGRNEGSEKTEKAEEKTMAGR
jgi:hypothetical protein